MNWLTAVIVALLLSAGPELFGETNVLPLVCGVATLHDQQESATE